MCDAMHQSGELNRKGEYTDVVAVVHPQYGGFLHRSSRNSSAGGHFIANISFSSRCARPSVVKPSQAAFYRSLCTSPGASQFAERLPGIAQLCLSFQPPLRFRAFVPFLSLAYSVIPFPFLYSPVCPVHPRQWEGLSTRSPRGK